MPLPELQAIATGSFAGSAVAYVCILHVCHACLMLFIGSGAILSAVLGSAS